RAATSSRRPPGTWHDVRPDGTTGQALMDAIWDSLEAFFLEVGRFFELLWRTLAWTVRRPFDWRELVRQMAKVGVASSPVVLLTMLFTGMGVALQTFKTLKSVIS